jgi:hypothetical protein
MKSCRMRYLEHVARIKEKKNAYNISVGKPKGDNHLEDLGADGRII